MDVEAIRADFPALNGEAGSRPSVFFDNPAGTQMAGRAIRRMVDAMTFANANLGGAFETSVRAGQEVDAAREAAMDFVNAHDRREIVFGQSMTTLTFAVSRALGHTVRAGDALLLTRMDHDANVAPWLMLAEERGLAVRWLDFDPGTFEYDLTRLDELLDGRVRIAALNYASNVIGTVNDVTTIVRHARAAGALTYVDAVQFAPHRLVDVQAIGCDMLVCSAYKFYGPHQAILWGRGELLDGLRTYKVRPASSQAPGNLETGTKSREAIAGVFGAIEQFAAWGGEADGGPTSKRRTRIAAGYRALEAHEGALTRRLIQALEGQPRVRIHGLTATQAMARRVPTVSFTVEGRAPDVVAAAMARAGISVWSGHNYGIEPIARLGLSETGGVVRVGLAAYNTADEVDAFASALDGIIGR